MCSYLVRRGAAHYFRLSVPVAIRSALQGRREIVVSLRTKDRAVARRLIGHRLVEAERLFHEARKALGLEAAISPVESTTSTPRLVAVAASDEGAMTSLRGVVTASALPMLDRDVVPRWAVERKVQKKGEDAHRAVAEWFYDRVGRKPVRDIQRKDVLTFKDALIGEGQSLGNVRVKLSRLRTLLQWAADNELGSKPNQHLEGRWFS